MRTRVYLLCLVILAERWLEYQTPLAPVPHTIAQIALISGMSSLVFAWICVERNSTELAMEPQPVLIQPRTNSRR